MAMTSTIGQKILTTAGTRYQITATGGQKLTRGIKISVVTANAKVYVGDSSVTTSNGFYLVNGVGEMHSADFEWCSDLYLVSDTNSTVVTYDFVGQTVAIT